MNEEVSHHKSMSKYKVVTGAIVVISLLFSMFQLYTCAHGLMTALLQRSIHLSFAVTLVILFFPAIKDSRATFFIDVPLILVTLASTVYLYLSFDDLLYRLGTPNQLDVIFGVATIVVLLEATRRGVGWPMAIIAITSLLYTFFGNHLPGSLAHQGQSFERVISQMYLTTEGIFGVPLGVSATYLFLFLLFGAVLDKSGVGALFIDLAQAIAGKYQGGPARVAIIATATIGSISGSPVSDAATTGAFTIPLMKKMGYKAELAAAIEAAASCGASLLPPVMGAGAFVMADITGVPYSTILLHAVLPGFLFYIALMFVVGNEARKMDIKGLPEDELPRFKDALMNSLRLIIPVAVLVFFLAVVRTSPVRAALYSLVVMVVTTVIYNRFKPELAVPLKNLAQALIEAPRKVLVVACACATAGIIIGMLGLTGLGLRMSDLLISAAGGNLALVLLFSMCISLVLGMGLPPTACYIIMAVTVAPSLMAMGVPLLVAHFFIFYCCCHAPIEPPLALAAYTTAGIAGCNPIKTGFEAFRISLSGFILPFIFVYKNALLGFGSWYMVVAAFLTALMGVWSLSIVVVGWYQKRVNYLWRVCLVAATVMLMVNGLYWNVAGIGVLALFVFTNTSLLKREVFELDAEQA
jgi:TRAP transporter 4TM/12TM fusion protein